VANHKWIGSFDSGLDVFKGGDQLFNTGAHITVFQHPLTPRVLRITGFANNQHATNERFTTNHSPPQVLPHITLAPNTFYAEYTVPSNRNRMTINFSFTGGSASSNSLNLSSVQGAGSFVPLSELVELEITNSLHEEHWIFTEMLGESPGETHFRLARVEESLINNLTIKTARGNTVYARSDENSAWVRLDTVSKGNNATTLVNSAGEFKVVGEALLTVPHIQNLSNYPNPFNPETTITFTLSDDSSMATLEVFDIRGRKVRTLFTGSLREGDHRFTWNGRNDNDISSSSGLYFVRLASENESQTKKILMIK
jgi:hypothetical protein